MKNIIPYLKELFLNPKFQTVWIAIGSIGTFLMAMATFKSLYYYRRREQKRLNEELLENILIPIVKELTEIIQCLRELDLPHTFSTKWGYKEIEESSWSKIKRERAYLIYNLNKNLLARIKNFYQDFKQLVYLFNQHIEQINSIVEEEAKHRIIKRPYFEHISSPRNMLYNLSIGGRLYSISFYRLIFEDTTLDNYINKIKDSEQLPNKQVQKIEFKVDGIGRRELTDRDFMELDLRIKQRIYQSDDLKEFIAKCRDFYERAIELRDGIGKAIAKYR